MKDSIIIRGARVHNLKNVSLEIPHNKLVAFTGVSGSGKSSLAFDTIFAEGQRRYIESLSPYARQFLGQMKPADVDEIIGLAPSISIDQKALSHNPRSTVGTLTEIYDYLRVLYARLGEVYCPKCNHKIDKLALDEMIDIIKSRAKELDEEYVTILSPVVVDRKGEYYQLLYDYLALGFSEARIDGQFYSLHEKVKLARHSKHSIDIVIDRVMISDEGRLSEAVENSINYATGLAIALFREKKQDSPEFLLSSNWTCPNDGFAFPEVEPRLFSFNSPHGACEKCNGLGRVVEWGAKKKFDDQGEEIGEYKNKYEKNIEPCLSCHGQRLRAEPLAVKINKKNIAEVSALSIEQAYAFFVDYHNKMTSRQKEIAENVVIEIGDRLDFLLQVGLNYLSLSREAETLSGGEAQRIRLGSQIGSHLSKTLYVLDEPTIGLHERDTERLIKTLKALKDQGNSVIIVEHDERTIMASDYLVDLGPLAGRHGGEVVAIGETKELLKKTNPQKSLTLEYLRGERFIETASNRRTTTSEAIKIIGARANNLKNVQVDIPLRKMVCITGVSGSGKSSLLYDVLYKNVQKIKANPRLATNVKKEDLEDVSKIIGTEYINRVVIVDQSPIGRTPRSNPATYTGIFTPIREFFAMLPESRERSYTLSRFSFNRPGGRCEACDGAGVNLIEMHFLPAVTVECEVCHGKRFNRETLQVKYKGKNISEVLALTIDEAIDYFDTHYQITDKLKVLQEVGLCYLQLGQSATTLSGGEAQRIKLARELTHTLGRKTLYLLDEPTVGLHYHDIELLLGVLNKLIDRQNSIAVIEHNLHIIHAADYVIDLGPEGGDRGGYIVAKGTPEQVMKDPKSVTGKYIKEYLK
ncbi:excinuclease ABC subunit UvrA [Candidatus Falkowbacteria bacterium]|uniref:UvrABC system protein A n=1 Tax=Candidatus Buchananbacteria bacterium CG10_big_fil_rev_8_21_14_0_10_33_19 TaxID=1974525 RepID=A0A2H0W3W8_9BACT|nr:excinuclease ABC subunit UvrA [Candidatus Falkowbacteria bacterium]PIS06048.1 MAG: excinuclease ABC subunit A [Candidatus Buchananbacteria bacterium CG10_big_fil_rev_8_21_14_0_10_33_19]